MLTGAYLMLAGQLMVVVAIGYVLFQKTKKK